MGNLGITCMVTQLRHDLQDSIIISDILSVKNEVAELILATASMDYSEQKSTIVTERVKTRIVQAYAKLASKLMEHALQYKSREGICEEARTKFLASFGALIEELCTVDMQFIYDSLVSKCDISVHTTNSQLTEFSTTVTRIHRIQRRFRSIEADFV